MQLFVDNADINEIKRLYDLYPIDGVTTNPTILARVGGDPAAVLKEIRRFLGPDGLLFVQAVGVKAEGIVEDAHRILEICGKGTIIKIPAIPEGFKAIRMLKEEGITTCGTVVYAPMQAFFAAKAGASYVAPYVNRIDDMGFDGTKVTKEIQDMMINNHFDCAVLAASFRNSQQVMELFVCGVGSATVSPEVFDRFVKNPAIDSAVKGFNDDFERATGRKSMSDL